uniref:Iron-sulfur cluster assembly protein n=1 Tax=Pyramimonas obovata TaxID=1411642 RepID=A0A7S0RU28_9CHLO|mmetsp:Transcript_6833/g.13821  ORF Transcript_6833/g.13821 Transcript_6833/m.13821 type:complete len:165 (+) Transcript_6833:97-591(+)|eukprot:CAMPEP_0118931908 /NCGR_PEP_ID=MMETSP1169-20130426/8628_1 /TAXON_ID=36882 /ORGANISM="Pyramimonas obovata, Strain CCMP722" /LENGTH=164 /DNA_ID=CAMNT_0006874485 /DNA_START=97 /DNA_END=591 /DNA_ORIENTATION=+
MAGIMRSVFPAGNLLQTTLRSACAGNLSVLSGARSYHENVVSHYEKPSNVGSFDKNDPNVGTGLVGAPACGDVMKLQIKVDDDGNIVDSCFKTFGCGSAIASSSVATEWIKGKKIDEAVTIKNSEIAKHLSLPPVKLHCSMLAEDAIKAAVKNIQEKRAAAAAK